MNIISITPALPPEVNGLGDYAFALAKELRKSFNHNTCFVSAKANSIESVNGFKVLPFPKDENTFMLILKTNEISHILIHFVSYAYSAYGLPYSLLKLISKTKKVNPDIKIITVFHELYDRGNILKKSFWLYPFQKSITEEIYLLSEHSIVSSSITFEELEKVSSKKDLKIIPVFSNIGESDSNKPFHERENDLVVFGGKGKRSFIYSKFIEQLREIISVFKISRIIDIGPGLNIPARIDQVPVISKGILPSDEISKYLSNSKFGVLKNEIALLPKSGIFAAYTSHGVVPLVFTDGKLNKENDGLADGVNFVKDLNRIPDLQKISSNAFTWYKKHTVASYAGIINSCLN